MFKHGKTLEQLRREKEWDMGQARTCLVCGDVFLTRKNLRIHRANHRKRTEMLCEKIVIT